MSHILGSLTLGICKILIIHRTANKITAEKQVLIGDVKRLIPAMLKVKYLWRMYIFGSIINELYTFNQRFLTASILLVYVATNGVLSAAKVSEEGIVECGMRTLWCTTGYPHHQWAVLHSKGEG
jgi:hypothetical protein